MKNRLYEQYLKIINGDKPTEPKVNNVDFMTNRNTLADYQKAVSKPVAVDVLGNVSGTTPLTPPKTPKLEEYQNAVQTPTTTQSDRPSSWNTLLSFLNTNIDGNRDWGAENITDASLIDQAYNEGKISREQRTEGRIALENYLKDVDAQRAYSNAMAEAENQARRNTAYNDYLASRLASYLKEVQGTSGLDGYDGVTKGQAINLANIEAQRQGDVNAQRQQAESNAFEAYRQALRENSDFATDQRTNLDASHDAQEDVSYSNGNAMVGTYVESILDENGKISQSDYNKLVEYINTMPDVADGVKEKLLRDAELLYGKLVITDEEAKKSENATLADILRNTVNRDNFDTEIGKLTEDQRNDLDDVIKEIENREFPIGRGKVAEGVKADYEASGHYTFTYGGKTYSSMERITEDPLGSDTGTLNYNESANRFFVPNPKDAKYGDILVVEKDGTQYFYVKRNTKWYYLCNSKETKYIQQ